MLMVSSVVTDVRIYGNDLFRVAFKFRSGVGSLFEHDFRRYNARVLSSVANRRGCCRNGRVRGTYKWWKPINVLPRVAAPFP